MAQVRLLVPWTDDKGNTHAAGNVVNVDDETFAALRADGKASATADEDATAKREGSYTARTGREDTASTKTEAPRPKEKS